MQVKISNAEMEARINTLATLHEKGRLGYAIARNLRLFKETAADFLSVKGELFKKYGSQSEDGQSITVPAENVAAFVQELDGIEKIEHEVDVFLIDDESFINGTLDSAQMELLLWMVEDKKEGGE